MYKHRFFVAFMYRYMLKQSSLHKLFNEQMPMPDTHNALNYELYASFEDTSGSSFMNPMNDFKAKLRLEIEKKKKSVEPFASSRSDPPPPPPVKQTLQEQIEQYKLKKQTETIQENPFHQLHQLHQWMNNSNESTTAKTTDPSKTTDTIYTPDYLITDTDIDHIVDYYKRKKRKKHFVELFTSKMFLRKFKEPYKDDKIYQKYILQVLQDIAEAKTSSKKSRYLKSKKAAEMIPDEEEEEEDEDEDDDDEEEEKEEEKEESKVRKEEWQCMIFLGRLQQTQESWKIQFSSFREKKANRNTNPSFWERICKWIRSK